MRLSLLSHVKNMGTDTHTHVRKHSGDNARRIVQPEKAGCHSKLPSLATDKVDHREMSALRTCPSKSLPLAAHTHRHAQATSTSL